MRISTYKIADVIVLKLIGELDTSEVEKLLKIANKLLKDKKHIALDLSETEHINSFLIAVFTRILKDVRKKGGSCFIYFKKQNFYDVLEVIGFAKLMKMTLDYSVLVSFCEQASK